MMSAYNIIIYCILALYIASYTLRVIVYGWVRDADIYFNATSRIEDMIRNNESYLVKPMVEGWKHSDEKTSFSYFLEACKLDMCILCILSMLTRVGELSSVEIKRSYPPSLVLYY